MSSGTPPRAPRCRRRRGRRPPRVRRRVEPSPSAASGRAGWQRRRTCGRFLPIRREPIRVAPCRSTPAAPSTELRELRELTGDENGAQRVAWTDTWVQAKEWLQGKLAGLPLEYEVDEAGNQWWTLPGASDRAVLMGGHIDSVPNGGWLDGCAQRRRRRGGAAPDRGGRAAGDHGAPRQLGRRGGRALRPQPVRLERRVRDDGRPGGDPEPHGRERHPLGRRAPRARRRPRPRARRAPAALQRRRLPRAAHRAGAGARVDGPAARRGASARSASSAR